MYAWCRRGIIECLSGEGGTGVERDELLYERFLSGDEEGLRMLMERYGDRLTLYLRSFCESLDEAESLMIEAFARVSLKKPLLRYDSFRSYLFKTGRHLASRARRRLAVFSLEQLERDPESEACLEQTFLRDETHRALHRCLDRIDPAQREALWLIYFEDLRYAEAATVLGIREKQLDYLLQKGKRTLRTELEKEGVTNAQH